MKKISLEEVLAFREKRVLRREEILREYPFPLACLGLNIPGEYKDFPWARRAFDEEIESFRLALEAEGLAVSYWERETGIAGYTAFFSVDTAPERLKEIALRVEETHPLGRLFDADIYEPQGKKLSRGDSGAAPRPCLVCGENGFACARSRAHSAGELNAAVLKIMENWLRQKLGDTVSSAAAWAMMSEAAVTPKPGLVDRANNGSHGDMDFFSFVDSAAALLPWFRNCALAGFDSAGKKKDAGPEALFASLRPPGRIAEVIMKRASRGVNTHKGYVFSLGLLSAAYGYLFRAAEKPGLADIAEFTRAMTFSLDDDFARPGEGSHGKTVYAQSGARGIRGEAARGFPSVTELALPRLRRLLGEGHTLNDAGSAVLLELLASAEDTNIIHRGGIEALRAIREDLRAFFAESPDMESIKEKAAALDRDFTARNLSPGGSADLLGVTLFLHRLLES